MFKGGLGDILQQASKMREEMQRTQEQLAKKTVEVSSGGGMVKLTANGRQEILSVEIDPEVLKLNDREMLQDLIRHGVNEAIKASQNMMADEMGKMAGALGPLASLLKGF